MSKDRAAGFHVLIAAAGTGARTGLTTPKQYCLIAGKTVLRHTVEKFLSLPKLKSLRVIINPSHRDFYDTAVAGLGLLPPVSGADTRKDSVRLGLAALADEPADDIVLIHDAARPFVTAQNIGDLLTALQTEDAATLVTPVADTLVDKNYAVHDRNALNAVQTPQGFRLGTIRAAHEKFAGDDRFTDDAGLIAAMEQKVFLVTGSRANIKITTAEDVTMAEKLMSLPRESRTGFGYDIHAFDTVPATSTRLGGVDVPHDRKLLGHSDADVVFHALTDALLGTIGEGDIGQLFPPSDMTWKNADSAIFLTEAVRRVVAKGGRIVHCDISLIAEEPKIGPHRPVMQSRIADILGLTPDRIGLKATTSEKLGALGRAEGIAAQAVATVSFPA